MPDNTSYEITVTITARTTIDPTLMYQPHLSDAGKALQTLKHKLSTLCDVQTFENSHTTEIKDEDQEPPKKQPIRYNYQDQPTQSFFDK